MIDAIWPLSPDIYEVVPVAVGSHGVVTTYKYGDQGSLRMWQTGDFRNQRIVIWNEERKAVYELDTDTNEYLEPWKSDRVALLARWIAPPHPPVR